MSSLFLVNLTSPPLLFFFLGVIAAFVRSDLQIPNQIAKFLSIYLLMAIGLKGGAALAQSTIDLKVVGDLAAATILASVLPVAAFIWLKRIFSVADAAALAATYGSISAVTFVTSTSYLDAAGVSWSGYMVAAMALMESPAIIVGLLLYWKHNSSKGSLEWGMLFRESFLNGSVLLILGSLVIGWLSGAEGMAKLDTFTKDLFLGALCLFLLDMGIVASQRIIDSRSSDIAKTVPRLPGKMLLSAIVLTVFNAVVAVMFAWFMKLPEGDAVLLIVLGASASYIAVPAAMRLSLPEANPSIYLTMSLAITFPINLLIGIPLYHQIVKLLIV